jgi:uncharacterized membrane protein
MTFIEQYFIEPILRNGWFNPYNTLAYGTILVIAVYLVFKMLKKMKIHIDLQFLYAILPFIFWGSTTRVLHDSAYYGKLTGMLGEFYSLPIFPTPGSYMITFLLALIVLLISLTIQRFTKLPYWKIMLSFGIILCVINVFFLPISDFFPLFIILEITGLWAILFFSFAGLSKNIKYLKTIFTKENSSLLSSHMLDASSTFVAMSFYGYLEQHVVPRLVIPILGPGSMFLLKLVVLIPVLYIIDKYSEKGDFRNFLKIVVLILGLAPGIRDLVRLMVGV